jgi:hypothetical protein
MLEEASKLIEAGKATFATHEHGYEVWIVPINGRDIPVWWNPETETIMTVLPKHSLKGLRREAKRGAKPSK